MKSPETETPIAMAINDGYAMPAAQILYSIGRESVLTPERAIILGSNLNSNSREILTRAAGSVGIHAEIYDSTSALEVLGDVPTTERMPIDVWARLLIPGEVKGVERCLYVDADTLCLRSLDQLLDADLGDNIVGAVRDTLTPDFKMADHLPKEGLTEAEEDTPYFNSGVMLMDCEKWRQAGITPQAAEFARRNPDSIRYWDQDALNIALHGNWKELDGQWNTHPISDLLKTDKEQELRSLLSWSTEDEELQRKKENCAGIMHFITKIKPWCREYPVGANLNRYRNVTYAVGELLGRHS